MDKNSKESKLESLKGYLSAIQRTHILFNDDCEAEALVGLNLTHGKKKKKKGGNDIFMKQAVLDSLSTLAKRIVCNENFILEEFLLDYEKAYDFTKKYFSRSNSFSLSNITGKEKRDKQFEIATFLLDYLICWNDRPETLTKNRRTILDDLFKIDKGYGQVVTILILIIFEILPPFERGKSKVSSIKSDFKILHSFYETYVEEKNLKNSHVPEMLWFNEEVNNLSELECCKINVFYFAYSIFSNISSYLDKERIYFMNKIKKQNCYSRYQIDGFWEADNIHNKLWEIEKIENSPEYIIREWLIQPNNGEKIYKYSSYLLLFIDKYHAYIRGPHYVYHLITEPNKIFKNDIAYLNVTTDDELKPVELNFESEVFTRSPLPNRLRKTRMSSLLEQLPPILEPATEKKAKEIESKMENCLYCNEISDLLSKDPAIIFPNDEKRDYYFTPALYAISPNAVYIIENEDCDFRYYRIPINREKSLSQVVLSDTAGILTINKKKYLAFFDQNSFFDLEEEWRLEKEEEDRLDEYFQKRKEGEDVKFPGEKLDYWIEKVSDYDDWTL